MSAPIPFRNAYIYMIVYLIAILLADNGNFLKKSLKNGEFSMKPLSDLSSNINPNEISSSDESIIPSENEMKANLVALTSFVSSFMSMFLRFAPSIYKNQKTISKRVKYHQAIHKLENTSKALKFETIEWFKILNPNFDPIAYEEVCIVNSKRIEEEEEFFTLRNLNDIDLESDQHKLVQNFREKIWNRVIREDVIASNYFGYDESEDVFNILKNIVIAHGFDQNQYLENFSMRDEFKFDLDRFKNEIIKKSLPEMVLKQLYFFATHAKSILELRHLVTDRKREIYKIYKTEIDIYLKPNYSIAEILSKDPVIDL